jgi:hypothetical protein
LKKSPTSCGVSTAVGSSKMMHARAAEQDLDDLDALLDHRREAASIERVGSTSSP